MTEKKFSIIGILFAVSATLIWSGNYIVARHVKEAISPIGLAFLRWFCASLIMFVIAFKSIKKDYLVFIKNRTYFFWASLCGITIFNTLLYHASHFTIATNVALISTTLTALFSIALAIIFTKEKLSFPKITGIFICIIGIWILQMRENWSTPSAFSFHAGDSWLIAAAICFSVYNLLIKKRPPTISTNSFLFYTFSFGTLMLLPFFLLETNTHQTISLSWSLAGMVLYIGAGASVVAYFCWNKAIEKMGISHTALFGNLIPLFSMVEAVLLLKEEVTKWHILGAVFIVAGIIITHLKKANNS